jgi:predicted esterase
MASICGGGDPARAARLRALPVLVAHGIDDPVVPIACSRTMAEAVRAAGGSVTVREYPGVGHEAWLKAYTTEADGVLTWMFAQHRGTVK